jgi:hypothetical protein
MSRKSKPWACAWPAAASIVPATNSKAKTRVIFFLAKTSNQQVETGHNCRSFASKQAVSAAFSNTAVKKGNTPEAMAALCPKPLTKRANND